MGEFIIDKWNVHGFELYGKTSGKFATTCAHCSHTRKKNKEKCCSVDLGTGKYTCSHCGRSGNLHTYRRAESVGAKKEYKLPQIQKTNFTNLPDKVVEYFNGRGIKQDTLIRKEIMYKENEWMPQPKKEVPVIMFPYFENEELVNIKYRTGKKEFKMSKDAKLIPYNLDSGLQAARERGYLIWCEGEIDALTYDQEGYPNVLSVPNGATVTPEEITEYNETGDIKESKHNANLEYLDNVWKKISHEDIKLHYISTDSDAAGYKLRQELIRRLGASKCRLINHGQHKDANDALKYDGDPNVIKNMVDGAIEIKVPEIIYLVDVKESMLYDFDHGKPRGTTTYVTQINKAWTWRSTEINTWTGYNNEGKGTFLKYMNLLKARFGGQKKAVFTPEDMPVNDYYDDLIHMYIGKPVEAWSDYQMSKKEYNLAMDFVQEYFYVINPKEPKLSKIIDLFGYLVASKGVTSWDIDPYNTVWHDTKAGETIDLYISRFMGELKRFAVDSKTNGNLVAHQKTPDGRDKQTGNYPMPSLYKIKGGGTFSDKTDNVIVIWKPNRGNNPTDPAVKFISQKIKKWRLVGKPSEVDLIFDWKTNRYLINDHSPLSSPLTTQSTIELEEEVVKNEVNANDTPLGDDDGYGDDMPF